MKLPPRWLRRIVLWPLPVVAAVLYVAAVPLLLIAAFVLSYRLPGKWRAVRALGLATVYLFVEAGVIVATFALWVASGFGWRLRSPGFLAAHYAILGWALRVLVAAGRRLYALEIEAQGQRLDVALDGDDVVPLIIMSRHAGPADSILLLHEVMAWKGRRPRIVAKDLLQFDPAFDILLNRLPCRFISPGGSGRAVEAIRDAASDMGPGDALVIFPEGGNFTERRRTKAIDRLREGGHEQAAERASRMRFVLPPRPAGTIAAMNACPTADAVFVAHTGLDTIATLGDVWFQLPQDNVLQLTWRRVPSADIPSTDEGKAEMLMLAWEAIDAWVAERRVD